MDDKKMSEKNNDLEIWEQAYSLVLDVYDIINKFPQEEILGLSVQMRKSAIAITSNISEGYSHTRNKEKIRFYSSAQSSIKELQYQLLISRDVKNVSKSDFDKITGQCVKLGKKIGNLINHLKKSENK